MKHLRFHGVKRITSYDRKMYTNTPFPFTSANGFQPEIADMISLISNGLCSQLFINFSTNYTLPELTVHGFSGVVNVSVREVTKGIDAISYLGEGR